MTVSDPAPFVSKALMLCATMDTVRQELHAVLMDDSLMNHKLRAVMKIAAHSADIRECVLNIEEEYERLLYKQETNDIINGKVRQ
jgi:hypothetical protein